MNSHVNDLKAFLDASPVNFLAVDELRRRLDAAGFSELRACDAWQLKPGDCRYVCVNGSALSEPATKLQDATATSPLRHSCSGAPGV